MRLAFLLALAAALLAPQQEDWCDELRKMSEEVNKIQGSLYLLRSLRQEMLRSGKALDESRLDLADRHLLRLAQVSRTYNETHANRVVAIALALRGEVRAEGAARVAAIAEDLKAGRPKEAQARIDDALGTPSIATTYRAEFERLRDWMKKAPDAAAVEAELARWRAMMPPGSLSACIPCKGTGEEDCTLCLVGTVAQSCRTCAGKGQGACALCNGKGKLVHGGYGGELVLRIDKEFKYRMPGEKGNRIVHPQRIFWSLRPCAGHGSFEVRAVSNPLDPNKSVSPEVRLTLKCGDLFDQLKANVFNGKARVFSSLREDKKDEMTVEQAKRFFAEYEKCKEGFIPCDACEGKLTGRCAPCGGKGSRLGPCLSCGGSGSTSCSTCKTSGDSTWLATLIPASRVPALGACLDAHVKALHEWQGKRAVARAKREQVRSQFIDAKKGLDPTAKLTPDFVNVPCGKCSGKGGACEECWGVGRREYFPGTPVYEKYALAKKLDDLFAQLSKSSLGVSSSEIQLHIADTSIDSDFKLPQAPKDAPEPPKPAPPPTGGGSGIGGEITGLPADLQAAIKKADALHEDGKAALEKARATDDNEVWKSEGKKAVKCFWEAQGLYADTQGTLDDRGIDVPRALIDKIRTNQQALVMARKQVP